MDGTCGGSCRRGLTTETARTGAYGEVDGYADRHGRPQVDDPSLGFRSLVPTERGQRPKRARWDAATATLEHEVSHEVGQADHHDQIADRHDLAGEANRDRVAQHSQCGAVVGELTSAGERHAVEFVDRDHLGFDQRLGPDRHGAIERDRNEIRGEADRDDGHADEVDVDPRERQSADQPHQCDRSRRTDVGEVDDHAAHDRDDEDG